MHKLWVVASMMGAALVAGCSDSTGGTGEARFNELITTGAVAGQKGKLRVVFTNPVSADTDVNLSSGSTAIATVPDHVTVLRGAISAEAEYVTTSPGMVLLSARLGDTTFSESTTVVDQLRLNRPGVSALEVGTRTAVSAGVNIVLPEPIDIALAVADTGVATVDASVHIPAFSSTAAAQLIAVGVGATSLTATLGQQQQLAPITIVDKARLNNANAPGVLEIGGTGTASISLDALVAETRQVTVTSSDPSVLSVPPTAVFPAGSSYAPVDVKALAPGRATLTYALGDSTFSTTTLVVADAQLDSIYTTLTGVQVGVATQLRINLNVTAAVAHEIQLSSSDPTVIAPPAKVVVPAGASGAAVTITPIANGNAVLTATYRDISRQVVVHVGPVETGLYLGVVPRIAVGAIAPLSVQFPAAIGYFTATIVSLSSSDPSVASVPSSITVYSSNTVPVTALKAGTTTITASANGATASYKVTVVDQPTIVGFGPTFTVPPGTTTAFNVLLDAIPAVGTQVTFSSSNEAVVATPPPAPINGSSAIYNYVTTTGISGTAILTATVAGKSQSATVYVGNSSGGLPAFYAFNSSSGSLEVGATTTANVYLNAMTMSPTTGDISFSVPGIVSTPSPTLNIGIGQSSLAFPVVGVAAGTTDVILDIGGVKRNVTVNVVATPGFSLSVPSTVKVGATVVGTLTPNCVLAKNTTLQLSSDMTNFATVSTPSLTLPPSPNLSSLNFGVTGVAAGNATVTATLGAATYSANITVAP